MCAGAQLYADVHAIIHAAEAAGLAVQVPEALRNARWEHEIWGFGRWNAATKTKSFEANPVIIATPAGPRLDELEFSLTPAWAKAYPLRASTYNARLNRPKTQRGSRTIQTDETGQPLFERVYQYPTYRAAWAQGRFCLVPLSAGIESSYSGDYDQQRFRFSLADGALMLLLGLWDEWINRDTGETHRGFTLFTAFPQTAMRRFGHHREVVMVDHTLWPVLLDGRPKTPDTYTQILQHRLDPNYQAGPYATLKTRKGAPAYEDFLYPEEDWQAMGPDGRAWLQERLAAAAAT